ncbi:Mpo1-like protein [Thalassotalea fusca]
MPTTKSYQSFKEFYPFYLSQHQNRVCRLLHVIGSLCVIALLVTTIITQIYTLLWLMPVAGYGFAWIGHFFFEHNKPATFTYPWYSFLADWVMLKDVLTGKLRQ